MLLVPLLPFLPLMPLLQPLPPLPLLHKTAVLHYYPCHFCKKLHKTTKKNVKTAHYMILLSFLPLLPPLPLLLKTAKKNPAKAATQNITSPALMSSSVKVVFHQGHLPLRSSSKVHHLEMMHARDQSIFLYLGSIMVA